MQLTSKTSRLLGGLTTACGLLGAAAMPAGAQSLNVDASGGTGFNPAIFGQGLNNQAFATEGRMAAYEKNLGLIRGASVRGPSEGANAMTYDWRTRVDANQSVPAPGGGYAKGKSTLDLLRDARDYKSTPIFTVNTSAIGVIDPSGNFVDTDTNINTLVQLAKDWVRYTNFIVQNYRQGQESLMSADDQRILNSLSWGGPDFSNDRLLKPGEAAVPKVNYWEIGNEVDLAGNSASAADYRSRFDYITTAMRGQDATIKVGPGTTGFQAGQPSYLKTLLKSGWDFSSWPFQNYPKLKVDFIAYHPYGYQILNVDAGNPANHGAISQQLNDIKGNQQYERDWVNTQISSAGRSPADFQFMATEWNSAYPSPPPGGDDNWRIRQWNALGVVETTMTFAQMGMAAAQFWTWPAFVDTGAELPQYKAFEALNKFGGDTLVQSYSEDNFRLYITKDSKTGTLTIWGMNFLYGDSGDADKTIHLSLSNLGITPGQITLMRLADTTGRTTLLSGNNFDYSPNGVLSVDWINTNMTGMNLSSFDFTVKPAELTMLVIQVPEPSAAWGGMFGLVLLFTSRSIVRQKASAFCHHLLPS